MEGNVGDEGVEVGKKGGWWVVPFLFFFFANVFGLGWFRGLGSQLSPCGRLYTKMHIGITTKMY